MCASHFSDQEKCSLYALGRVHRIATRLDPRRSLPSTSAARAGRVLLPARQARLVRWRGGPRSGSRWMRVAMPPRLSHDQRRPCRFTSGCPSAPNSSALIIKTDIADIPLARLAVTKQRVHVADLRQEAAYKAGHEHLVALIDKGGARTLLIVPMLKERTLVGAIAIYRQEVRPFYRQADCACGELRCSSGDCY